MLHLVPQRLMLLKDTQEKFISFFFIDSMGLATDVSIHQQVQNLSVVKQMERKLALLYGSSSNGVC